MFFALRSVKTKGFLTKHGIVQMQYYIYHRTKLNISKQFLEGLFFGGGGRLKCRSSGIDSSHLDSVKTARNRLRDFSSKKLADSPNQRYLQIYRIFLETKRFDRIKFGHSWFNSCRNDVVRVSIRQKDISDLFLSPHQSYFWSIASVPNELNIWQG